MTDRAEPPAEGLAVEKARTAPAPDDARKPESPADLTGRSWSYALKQAWAEFRRDDCTDLAAALTYYAVLSLFPALLAMISLVGVFGQGESTTDTLLELVGRIGQEDAVDQLREPISQMTETRAAGFALVFGLLGALWSASGYVGAFGRAMNKIYEVDEGRPFWKLRPLNVAITVVAVLLAAVVLLGLVVSGPFAEELGETLGLGSTTVTVWNIVKWPIMLLVACSWSRCCTTRLRTSSSPSSAGSASVPVSRSWCGSLRRLPSVSTSPTSGRTTRPTVRWPG
jgi:membrane protein